MINMKLDIVNRLAESRNLYIPGFNGKKSWKKNCRQVRPFWLAVEAWKSNQVIFILIGNLTLGEKKVPEELNVCMNSICCTILA